jgi:hypothetical protein
MQTRKKLNDVPFNFMPFFKCIFKDLLTNLNVQFCFFSKRDSWKPPTYQTETNFVWKNSDFETIPYNVWC